MGGGPSYPEATAQERNAQQAQTSLLQQYQDYLSKQQNQQDLLTPYIYEQFGLRPTYGEGHQREGTGTYYDENGELRQTGKPAEWVPGEVTGFERFETEDQRNQRAAQEQQQQQYEAQRQYYQAQEGIYGAQQTALEQQNKVSEAELQQLSTGKLLQNSALEQQGYILQKDDQGNITGITLDPNSTAAQQNAVNKQLLDREQQALAGTLPVDPSLERQFASSEELLRSRLQSQLGPGYETSTPGQKALADFQQRKQETIYSAQHGEIGSAASLAVAGQGTSRANTAAGQSSGALLQGAASYQNPYAGTGINSVQNVQSPANYGANTAAGVLGATQSLYGGSAGLGTLASLYGQSLAPYANQRGNEYQANQAQYGQQQNLYGGVGAILGSAAGGAFGGPVGAGAGGSAGNIIGRLLA